MRDEAQKTDVLGQAEQWCLPTLHQACETGHVALFVAGAPLEVVSGGFRLLCRYVDRDEGGIYVQPGEPRPAWSGVPAWLMENQPGYLFLPWSTLWAVKFLGKEGPHNGG